MPFYLIQLSLLYERWYVFIFIRFLIDNAMEGQEAALKFAALLSGGKQQG